MAEILLISCASKKLSHRALARDLYTSSLFRFSLHYALSQHPERSYILSAKYGLLGLDQEVEPYNQTLNSMRDKEIRFWADNVLRSLEKVADVEKDNFIFLAGEKYRRHLVSRLTHTYVPMEGLGIGNQLKFLKEYSLKPR